MIQKTMEQAHERGGSQLQRCRSRPSGRLPALGPVATREHAAVQPGWLPDRNCDRPGTVMPSEWLPYVWGGEDPMFDDQAQASAILGAILGAIMGRYNAILREIE